MGNMLAAVTGDPASVAEGVKDAKNEAYDPVSVRAELFSGVSVLTTTHPPNKLPTRFFFSNYQLVFFY